MTESPNAAARPRSQSDRWRWDDVRRFLLPVLALALSAAAIAALVTLRMPTQYESSVTLVVQTSAGANDTEVLVRTMIALVDSEVIGEALRERVGSSLPADDIAANLAVDRPPGSSVLTVYYYDTDAARSVAIAQQVVPVFQEQVEQLAVDQAGQLAPNYAIQPWGGGTVITTEIPSPILRNAGIAALLGALIGAVGAILYRQRRPVIRTAADAEEATGLPVVAAPGPLQSTRRQSRWHPTDVMDSVIGSLPAALGQRTLPRRLLIVGADNGRERSAFIAHFARALEQSGAKVMLVDADLETGRLSRHLGLHRRPGLADCLRSDLPPAETVTVPAAGIAEGLSVLPAGRRLPMRSGSASVVIGSLDDETARLLVDAPLLSSGQSLGPLLRNADAVLVLVTAGQAEVRSTTSLSNLVRALGPTPGATVLLTDNPEADPRVRPTVRPTVPRAASAR
jgi:Mrp family chromosome partitioning ATPase